MSGRASERWGAPRPAVDLRLLPGVVAGWTAVWAVTGAGAAVALAVLGMLLALGAVAAVPVARRGRGGRVLVVAAIGAVLVAAAAGRLVHREADPLQEWAEAGRTVTLVGRLSTDPAALPSPFGGLPRYVAQLSVRSATTQDAVRPGRARVTVFGAVAWQSFSAGQVVSVRGRLSPGEPGDAEIAQLSARSPPHLMDDGGAVWTGAESLRAGLRRATTGLSPDAGGLLPALVVGDTAGVSADLKERLRAAGLTHLTAVSGANLSIVAVAVTGLIALTGAGIRWRVLGSALAITGFVVLARPEPSVLRAAVMAGLGLLAVLGRRPGRGVPVLCACVVVLLVVDPWLARSFGFALSVLATGGLLVLVPAWLRRLEGPSSGSRRWVRPVAVALAVPTAALLATAPVVVLLQPSLSLVSVPANLLAEPAVAPATLLGLAAALVSPVWPGAAHALAWCGSLATGWIVAVAQRAQAVPGGSVPWSSGARGAGVLAAVVVGVTVVSLRAPRSRDRPPGLPLRWTAVGAVVLLVVVLGVAGRLPFTGRGVPADWVVVQCDVGQGSATLIRAGERRAVMVDTGPEPAAARRCLHRAGVRSLDLVVLTHFHADHVGGLAGVLPAAGRPPVVVSPFSAPSVQARTVLARTRAAGAPVHLGHAGLGGTVGAVAWRVLWPSPADAARMASAGPSAEEDGTTINDTSTAVLLVVGGLRVVALGDLETDAQQRLSPTVAGLGPVDVVVVAHHGSARQYWPLYRALRPRVALIGVGRENDYGHPAPGTTAQLRATGARVLETGHQGTLVVSGTPQRLTTSAD